MLSYQKIVSEGLKNLGIIKENQLKQALALQKTKGVCLSKVLLELGIISNENIAAFLVSQFGITPENITPEQISPEAVKLMPHKLASGHRIIPVKVEKGKLTVATDNLFNFLAVENLKKFLKVNELDIIFVGEEQFSACLKEIYRGKEVKETAPAKEQKGKRDLTEFLRQAEGVTGRDETPLIKLVTMLFEDAYQHRASDVHLEPLEDKFRIRYRIDGVLQEMPGPPKRLQGSLISRVKIMAGMNIAEKRLPQDGRIKFSSEGRDLDLRVSTIPSLHGEGVVVRILDRSRLVLDLEKLGFSLEQKKKYEELISLPNGIILVTGPTGCGKTTTLYTSLSRINKPTKKLLTLEDPVEYQLTGINQVQVKPEIGLTFASGLRSMLRQAPDIIMVGEIRDYETAAIAVQSSLTGHLIFSTLHTNNAIGAIVRLVDMGVKPYLVASTLQGVLAQRLVRTLCRNCRKPYQPEEEELKAFGKTPSQVKEITFYKARGCDECQSSGYRGRIGIFEFLILDDEFRNLICETPQSAELEKMARRKGMRSLKEDGWNKVIEAKTTLSEILRVTQQ